MMNGARKLPAVCANHTRWVGRGCGALVAVVTFLAFLPVLRNGFVNWDDPHNFLNNPAYRGLGWRNLRWMFTTMLLGHYVPLSWVTLGVNYVLGGMDPWGYHLGNLLLHAASATLFYLVARRLLAAGFANARAAEVCWGAAFAALAFGVHPLRVESVAWATERRDVLCAVFFLLAALAYLRGVAGGGPIQARWWVISVGAFSLSLLSKAAAMPLPAALLILDVYPLRRIRRVGWGRLVIEKLPYLALAGASAILALIAQGRAEAVSEYGQYGAAARLGMTGYNLAFYPWKFLWPADLSPLVELPGTVDVRAGRFLLPTIAVAAVTVMLVALRRRWPAGLAAWAFSALMVLPVTGAVVHAGIQLVADRYSYLSGLGFALLAGSACTWILERRDRVSGLARGACVVVAVLVIAGWAAGSWRQSKIWRDSETLWRYALSVDPENAYAHHYLGSALLAMGQVDSAKVELERALALLPDQHRNAKAVFHASVGVLLQGEGDIAGAERHYLAALTFSEDNVVALNNLAVIYTLRGERAAALDLFLHVLRVIPGYPSACLNARLLARALGLVPTELASCSERSEKGRAGPAGHADLPVEASKVARSSVEREASSPPGFSRHAGPGASKM